MKKVLLGMLVVAVAVGFAFTSFADEMEKVDQNTKVKVTDKKVKEETTTTVDSPEGTAKSKEKTEVTAKGEKETERATIKTKGKKETIEQESMTNKKGAKGRETVKIEEKDTREKVTAKDTMTPQGQETETAELKVDRKGMRKQDVTFKDFDEGTMTVTVIKGGATVHMPTSALDQWAVHPKDFKRGDKITIYSTYDPKLIKHVVRDAEYGKIVK